MQMILNIIYCPGRSWHGLQHDAPPAPGPDTGAQRPVYALPTVVTGDEESNMYLTLLESLEPHVLVPGQGYDSTVLYRLSPLGDATRVFDMKGWSTRLVRLR